MAKFIDPRDGEDGWTEWQFPIMDGYKMACCDCGLVHNMQFQVGEITKPDKNGWFSFLHLKAKKYRVAFRVSRNNRSTAAMRRKK